MIKYGEGWAPPYYILACESPHEMSVIQPFIPARTSTGLKRSAPFVQHQGKGEKYATGATTAIRGRKSVTIGTWNVRSLQASGRIEQLTHEMSRYQWHLLGLCEVRKKNSGEDLTLEGHKFFYSGREDIHHHGVGFLVNKDAVKAIMGWQPISSRLMTIRLRATPFNITIVQVYAPTSSYDDDEMEEFYEQLQAVVDTVPKQDILIVQGDWNGKVGEDAQTDWKSTCGPYCNKESNERGLRLLEFAGANQLCLANTFGMHKPSRRWTWHSPGGKYHNQIDYILVKRRFKSSIKTAKTRSFPGADVGSDHELVMMTLKLRLNTAKKNSNIRDKFNLEKLKSPEVANAFRSKVDERLFPLIEDIGKSNINVTMTAFNKAITETAKECLGRYQQPKKPWVTSDILDLCDKRRGLKNKRNTREGATEYKIINSLIKKSMTEAKESWLESKREEIDLNLKYNNSKRAYQLVKELTSKKGNRSSPILDKNGKCLTEDKDILSRWTEYCSELYSHKANGDPEILQVSPSSNKGNYPILREEVEMAVKHLKKGKSPGADNIPAELIQAGGEVMIDALTAICNNIWQTGEWPLVWTQSLIITIPKKGNLQLCQNYRTISLISHCSKVMLKILLMRLNPQAEGIIKEEQAGFRAGRNTMEQIFNLRIICERYLQHQQHLYHVFVDFKKAFDRVWHDALWATLKFYNIDEKLITVIEGLYKSATSAVYHNNTIGQWFSPTVGTRQGCLLSPTLFNIFLERIMTEALDEHQGSVSIGGRNITNLRFADDIDGLAGTEDELKSLMDNLQRVVKAYGMEVNADKTKIMTNNPEGIITDISVDGQVLETVESFKYLGAIVSDEGSRKEILSRIAQATAMFHKLNSLWKDKNLAVKSKIRLMRTLVISILLYACESWTLTAELERKISATEMKFYRRLFNIRYQDHITNLEVAERVTAAVGPMETLLSTVKRRKLMWFGHVVRSDGLAKTVLQGTVRGGRRRGRQRKRWEDNVKEWTGLTLHEAMKIASDRDAWKTVTVNCCVVPLRSTATMG